MKHWKKLAAPVIITVIILFYYIGIAVLFMKLRNFPVMIRILMTVIPLILSAVMIGVLISRIKEIKEGEEDDLSQY